MQDRHRHFVFFTSNILSNWLLVNAQSYCSIWWPCLNHIRNQSCVCQIIICWQTGDILFQNIAKTLTATKVLSPFFFNFCCFDVFDVLLDVVRKHSVFVLKICFYYWLQATTCPSWHMGYLTNISWRAMVQIPIFWNFTARRIPVHMEQGGLSLNREWVMQQAVATRPTFGQW